MSRRTKIPPSLAFHVAGAPRPWPRPVTARDGHVYANTSADEWGHAVRAACAEALLDVPGPWPREGVHHLHMVFSFERPQTHYSQKRWMRERPLKANAPAAHTKRPDIDNLCKQVLDCLGAWKDLPPLLWWDDGQVTWLQASKRWAHWSGVQARLWWYPQ